MNIHFANEKAVLWCMMENTTSVMQFTSDKSAATEITLAGVLHTIVKWLIFTSIIVKILFSKLYHFKHLILVFLYLGSMVSLPS